MNKSCLFLCRYKSSIIVLMMEVITTSETFYFYEITRYNNKEDCHLQFSRHENLKHQHYA